MRASEDITYDYAIIGSGIAGMICAAYLSAKGKKIILIEKNHQLGGALQVFSRDKKIFDTGVHYIGSMAYGKPLHSLFNFIGIADKLNFAPLDIHGFDRIYLEETGIYYPMSQGWDRFISDLAFYFPEQYNGLLLLREKIRDTTSRFLPFYLKRPANYIPFDYLSEKLSDVLDQLFTDPLIIKVLTGNSILYAYNKSTTPFYVFALILESYIEGAFRMVRGGSQIARELSKVIHTNGGRIVKHAEVVSIDTVDKLVTSVQLHNGSEIKALRFVSNLHPSVTMDLLRPNILRSSYLKRIKELDNGSSFVSVQFSLKASNIPYFNHNIYYLLTGAEPGDIVHKINADWPQHFLVCTGRDAFQQSYANTLTVLAHAEYVDFVEWEISHNTILSPGERGENYYRMKEGLIEKIISRLEKVIPQIRTAITAAYCSTPLTIRDFLNSPEGTAYGIEKNAPEIIKCLIPPYTKIPNLFLTGQNTDIHGIYGTSISALLTLSHLPEGKNIWEEIALQQK